MATPHRQRHTTHRQRHTNERGRESTEREREQRQRREREERERRERAERERAERERRERAQRERRERAERERRERETMRERCGGFRDIALTYHTKLTREQQEEVREHFRSMDGNRDEKITINEFLDSFQINGSSRSSYYKDFEDLGKTREGSLDFSEFITICYYFCYRENFRHIIQCDGRGCRALLNGKTYFTCVYCFDRSGHSFDLCCSCYSNNNFRHTHENDPAPPVFQDTSLMLLRKRYENEAGAIVPRRRTSATTRTPLLPGALGIANTIINIFSNIVSVFGVCTIM